MAADDYIAVPPDSVATGNTKIKTSLTLDAAGNSIEIQAVVVTDENGNVTVPISEKTGREICDLLRTANNYLKKLSKSL